VEVTERSLWRHPDFMKLWTGQTVSEFGSIVTRTALPLVAIITLHATAFEVGGAGHGGPARDAEEAR
jgi:hypothetical protein